VDEPSLAGCNAKLDWAHKHLKVLEAELAAAPDYADPIFFAQKFDPDSSTIKVTLQGVPDLPPEWGLIAADFLQNVRAALNYLVWELSRWNLRLNGKTRDPERETQFPIFYREVGEWSERRISDLHPDHVAIVRGLQPSQIEVQVPPEIADLVAADLVPIPDAIFRERDGAIATHPLTLLAKLTNDDKHRGLPVALLGGWTVHLTGLTGRNCVLGEAAWGRMMPHLENDAEWGTVEVTPTGEGKPEVEMDDKIEVAEPTIGGLRVTDLPIIGIEAERIVSLFASMFSE
jgi:hypothetical protein